MSDENPNENLVLAVHDKDLDKVLREIGLLERLEATGIRCEICDGNVTKENLREKTDITKGPVRQSLALHLQHGVYWRKACHLSP